jgi:hypothetical protein
MLFTCSFWESFDQTEQSFEKMKVAETTCWDLAYIPKIFGLEKERIQAILQRCLEEWKF